MNGKGQVFFFTLMLAVVVIVLALALATPIKQSVDTSMNATINDDVGLDCSNTSIPPFQKGQCVLTDLTTPYFFYGLIGIAGIIIGARLITQQ
jgi:type IV secretory pathway protease TraF